MDTQRVALIVMDLQVRMIEAYGADAAYLAGVQRAIAAAHAIPIPVIYVRVAFRRGHPEVADSNRIFSSIARTGALTEDAVSSAFHPTIEPGPDDIVVTKRRISAFAGSDLDVVLRALDIGTLVLCGIATSGVVLSTVREAADRDFGLVVLADGCRDADDDVHRVLTRKVFPRQGEVMSVDEWVRNIQSA